MELGEISKVLSFSYQLHSNKNTPKVTRRLPLDERSLTGSLPDQLALASLLS